ncbi:glycosyltransferase family 39 protein [bacterium]|nr:glycosyltransferase family 39 protein [bacterium]
MINFESAGPSLVRESALTFPEPKVIARHLLAISLIAAAWYFLRQWYLFQGPIDQLLFTGLHAAFLVVVLSPYLHNLKSVSLPRLLLCTAFLFLIIPWGEWIRLSTATSRSEWSLQIYQQTVFLYASFLLLHLFPKAASIIDSILSKFLEALSSRPALLWILPLLFLVFTLWIAFFVYHLKPIVQDSAAHLFQAKIFLNGKLFAPAPPAPDFFSIVGDMLVIKDGRWFGMYQPGFAAILALAMLIKAEWFVCPILGAATIAIWISYVRRWHNPQAAVLFGLLALLSPFLFMMSSTIMVFTPELFTASCLIYLCRLQTEEEKRWRYALIFFLMLYATLVRSFSVVPFLAPALAYSAWNRFRVRSYLCPVSIAAGIVLGSAIMMWYQQQTSGNPFLPGYLIEYPDVGYGFGKHFAGVHSTTKSLENISNNILGINEWLNGWLSGSMFFAILFFLVEKRIRKWDVLLMLGCAGLAFFYFFFFFQDLFFGPRYYYCFAPVFLLMVTRSIRPDEHAFPDLQKYIGSVCVIALLTFLPFKFPQFLNRYPHDTNAGYLQEEIARNGNQKRLAFLDRNMQNFFINWNDPFLRNPVIIVKDLGDRNPEAIKSFPDYKPSYFRMEMNFDNKKIETTTKFFDVPDKEPSGYLSLFELAMTLQAANDYWTRDSFDTTYTDYFNAFESAMNMEYLRKEEAKLPERMTYRDHFRSALIHSARMLLLPKLAFENRGLDWSKAFHADQFRKEFRAAEEDCKTAGDTCDGILRQLERVKKRIDRNRDGEMSDSELDRYLIEKIRILFMGG